VAIHLLQKWSKVTKNCHLKNIAKVQFESLTFVAPCWWNWLQLSILSTFYAHILRLKWAKKLDCHFCPFGIFSSKSSSLNIGENDSRCKFHLHSISRFYTHRSQEHKKDWQLDCLFVHLESLQVKAVCKTLVKLTQRVCCSLIARSDYLEGFVSFKFCWFNSILLFLLDRLFPLFLKLFLFVSFLIILLYLFCLNFLLFYFILFIYLAILLLLFPIV